MRGVCFLLLLVLLSGCATSGVQIQADQLQFLKVGETTYQDVVAHFGQPTATVVDSGGLRVATYSYMHVQTRPETFIPVVGLVAGGADAKGNSVSFVFSQDGKLMSYSSSDVNIKSGAGTTGGTAGDSR